MQSISTLNPHLYPLLSNVLFTILISSQLILIDANKRCESHRVSLRAAIQDHALHTHVLRKVNGSNFQECYEQCIDECSCRTFQVYQDTDCELLYEDQHSAPQNFKHRSGYKYYQLIRTYQCPAGSCSGPVCSNKCCDPNPCLNGGTCTELCHDPKTKLKCACAQGFAGRFCGENLALKSCIDYLALWPDSLSGIHHLLDAADQTYRTYCDFDLDNWMVWTLIESFAFSQSSLYKFKAFFVDNARNELNFNWHSFRLSLAHMKELRNQTTHIRATCNFAPPGGASYTDYLEVKMTEFDPITFNSDKCVTYEFLSVHGYNCSDCLFYLDQRNNYHLHVNSYKGPQKCPTSFAVPNAMSGPGPDFKGEDNFGVYTTPNLVHGCSSSPYATTQWWMGRTLCDEPRTNINCTCPNGYIGKLNGRFCGKTLMKTSCKEYLVADPGATTGEYYLLDTAGHPYHSYCDFNSEVGMAWTLVESFALHRKSDFQAFYTDSAVYDKSFNWPSFRLPLARMRDLLDQSTHFRATCNYSTSGVATLKDYLRVKISELNPITFSSRKCVKFEFLSIHGYNCTDCVFELEQKTNRHLHVDSREAPDRCSTSFSVPSAVVGPPPRENGEDNFGYFSVSNPVHGCSSYASATTEWWFGA